ncbi:ubiquinone-dependent pyruvate dehydrogenase [Telmatobacter bradus]|uniref:ubiquinone-dependent pyruvate dehydrogenase n=1 Tax=Telmatobacter bradus TaxID=474953 RepID=UPI003B43715C
MAKKVAEVFVEVLAAAGVKRIFGVAGDSLNGITDSIRVRNGIQWVGVRHEETAAFAAGAEAGLTGGLGVCAGSCGPGNLHLINGLYDAHRSRVPVLAIAAHIPSQEIGSNYFQETHPEHLFKECSAFCELVSTPAQMPRTLEIAIQTALAKRDVAVIIIPGDVALSDAVNPKRRVEFTFAQPNITPRPMEMARLATELNLASKVTILAGAGCAEAHDELVALAGKLKSPIVHAMRGKEFIEYDNPYDVGMTGLLGFASGYQAMKSCDTLLMLGTDFPYQQFYPKDTKIIQVDVRQEQIGRRAAVNLGIVGGVQETLAALLPLLEEKTDDRHLQTALSNYREARKGLDDLAVGTPGKLPIHPQYLAKVLNEVAAEDAVFTVDVGTPVIWAARYLEMNGKRRILGSFNHGSMANALPQAIGAQVAYPGRQVVTLSGDGGMSMLMGDLLSLRQQKLPVKMVVFNNSALGFVELEMKATGFVDHGTELINPDFSKIAEGAGILGIHIEKPEDIRPSLTKAFAHDGPALIDVRINRQELAMPPALQLDQIVDFNLYMVKAILNGRGDQILDLAKTNLFR